jgi:hypothetical protein
LFFGFLGCFLGYNIDVIIQKFMLFFNTLIYYFLFLFNKKWFFDSLYYFISNIVLLFVYEYVFKLIDRGLIESFAVLSLVRFFKGVSLSFSFLQFGILYFYAFIVLFFIVAVLFSVMYLFQFIFILILILMVELISDF